ncbi:MAG: DNA repair protein RecO [Alphaproteobacteria bacterium]|nr:DNA repair protein RecO [Alphaproteobacteria bacterium]
MSKSRPLSHEPAFVLHQYPWSESSLILEVFTRHHGRLAVAAKGVKRPTSSFRPVLLPLQPLSLSLGGDGEIRNLKSAEWQGGHVMPSGDPLLAGFYLNELLLRLLARDDPHPVLFDCYRQAVLMLAQGGESAVTPALRAFELLLLRDVGFLPSLSAQTLSLQPLTQDAAYDLVPEGGLRKPSPDDGSDEGRRPRLLGRHWLALQDTLDADHPFADLVRLLAQWQQEDRTALQQQLRGMIQHHCGAELLKTRQLMMDLQNL